MNNIYIQEAIYREILMQLNQVCTKLLTIQQTQQNGEGVKEEWVSNQDFLRLMGISKLTASTWRSRRKISYSKIGKKIYYKRSDIAQLIQKHRRPEI